MKKLIAFVCMICQWSLGFSGPLIYLGSTPENDGCISSFDDIVLRFDLENVIAENGEGEWGICVSGAYAAAMPQLEKSASLYLGDDATGEPLMRLASSIKPPSALFKVGNEFHLSFPNIEVVEGQTYTLKICYDFYAGLAGNTTWTTNTKLSFYSEPLILKFKGSANAAKVLKTDSNSLLGTTEKESIGNCQISFNYDVNLLSSFQAQIVEGTDVICSAESFSVDASDSKSIVINFPDNTLYKGHNYSVEIPEGCISVAGEADVLNSAISIPVKGAAYRHYGASGIMPRPNMKTLLTEVQITYDLPTGIGLVYVSDDTTYPLSVYKVNDDGTDTYLETINGEYLNDHALKFIPKADFDADSKYKFVMEDDVFKAYEVGAPKVTRCEEYLCDRIEFALSTVDSSTIPTVEIGDLTDEQSNLAEFGYPRVSLTGCEYNGQFYGLNGQNKSVKLYVKEGETETLIENAIPSIAYIKSNGEYYLEVLNLPTIELEAGKVYRVEIPAGILSIKQPLLAKYSGNEAKSLYIYGTVPTEHTVTIEGSDGHTTKSVMARHQNVKLAFEAPEGREIQQVKLNGEDVELNDGFYTINDIRDDASFYVALDEVKPEKVEYVNVNLTIGHSEAHSAAYSHATVKNQDATVNVSGANGWELAKLTLNGDENDVTADVVNGLYTIPAESLKEDANLNAVYSYKNAVSFDFTTSVDGVIDGCDYKVYSVDGQLVIENIPANTLVSVYSTAGLHIISENSGNLDVARISLTPGIYVVVLQMQNGDKDALKVRH